MRGPGSATAGKRRRVGGAIDTRRTDPRNHRICRNFFSSTGRGAFSFWHPKKSLGTHPRGAPAISPGPPGKGRSRENAWLECRSQADPPYALAGVGKGSGLIPRPSPVACSAGDAFPWEKAFGRKQRTDTGSALTGALMEKSPIPGAAPWGDSGCRREPAVPDLSAESPAYGKSPPRRGRR